MFLLVREESAWLLVIETSILKIPSIANEVLLSHRCEMCVVSLRGLRGLCAGFDCWGLLCSIPFMCRPYKPLHLAIYKRRGEWLNLFLLQKLKLWVMSSQAWSITWWDFCFAETFYCTVQVLLDYFAFSVFRLKALTLSFRLSWDDTTCFSTIEL